MEKPGNNNYTEGLEGQASDGQKKSILRRDAVVQTL